MKMVAKLTTGFCPHCKTKLVMPTGPLDAKIGILSDHPGEEEIKQGKPLVGKTGQVVHAELARVGIPLWECRVTNLWMHEPLDECDIDWHATQAAVAISRCEYVMIMGADACNYFLDRNVSDISGIKMKSKFLPKAKAIVASPNPAIVFHAPSGELLLAIERFALITKHKKAGFVHISK